MKIGFLFAGQGSQSVGMGKDLYDEFEQVRKTYSKVKELTNIDIAKISFAGPEEELNKTQNTQLAVLTMSLGVLELLKQANIKCDMSAGLSLGEYTALINSGALSFEDGVKLVCKRGKYMQELLPEGNWKMAAIMGLEDSQVEELCKQVKTGFVVPANYNCTGQVVISGEENAVLEAQELAKQMGVKKVRILNTAGPFHTEKLIDASNALRKELEKVNINKFETKVIKNIDGNFYKETDNVKDILAKHIISPVQFTKTLENMVNNGVDTFIEIGPGRTLSGLAKRVKTDKPLQIYNVNSVGNLKETLSAT